MWWLSYARIKNNYLSSLVDGHQYLSINPPAVFLSILTDLQVLSEK